MHTIEIAAREAADRLHAVVQDMAETMPATLILKALLRDLQELIDHFKRAETLYAWAEAERPDRVAKMKALFTAQSFKLARLTERANTALGRHESPSLAVLDKTSRQQVRVLLERIQRDVKAENRMRREMELRATAPARRAARKARKASKPKPPSD